MDQQPLSIVTMDDGEKIFVCESPRRVVERVNGADARLITLTRWFVSGARAIDVRPGDVRKVEVNA